MAKVFEAKLGYYRMQKIIRIGTRDSQLAMWQAKTVQKLIRTIRS